MTGGELIRLQCYEGIDVSQAVYDWDYARQLLHLRAAEATGRDRVPVGRRPRGRALRRTVPDQAGPAPGDRADRGPATGAADRRDRPRRRRVRGLPARGALRLPDHRPRDRSVPGEPAAARGAHVEPHPRRARRPEAPLPLPLGRASRLRARGGDRQAARARRRRRPGPPGRRCGRGAPRAQPVQAARRRRDDRLGDGARAARRDPARRGDGGQHARCGHQVPRGRPAGRAARHRRRRQAGRSRRACATGERCTADGQTPPPGSPADPSEIAVAYSQILRGVGLRVPASSTHAFAEALCAVGLDTPRRRLLGRAGPRSSVAPRTSSRSTGRSPCSSRAAPGCAPRAGRAPRARDDRGRHRRRLERRRPADGDDPNDDETIELRFSAAEVLRHKDFAAYTDDELHLAQSLMSELRLVGSPAASLRLQATSRATRRARHPPDRAGVDAGRWRTGAPPLPRALDHDCADSSSCST